MSARPGAIKAIIPVNVKRRRERAAPEFTDVYRAVEQLLSTEAVD
jgi:ABC-type nitrate/sulfonate/bicarbonate transport system ATPase subunit